MPHQKTQLSHQKVEQFSKIGKKRWNLCDYDEEDENIYLTTVPFTIALQDLYNKVNFEVAEPETKNNS